MAQELTTRTEKFNAKMQKSAALQAELDAIQKKNAQRAVDEYTKYGVIGLHDLKQQGIDLDDDRIAMFASYRGMERFYELTHADRTELIAMVTVPMQQKITTLQEEVGQLKGIIAKLVEQNEKQSALLEKVLFTPTTQAPAQEWLIPPQEVQKETKEPVAQPSVHGIPKITVKRGPIPTRVTEAKAYLDSNVTESGNVRWKTDPRGLIVAFLTLLKYNGVDIKASHLQKQHPGLYNVIVRCIGAPVNEKLVDLMKEVK